MRNWVSILSVVAVASIVFVACQKGAGDGAQNESDCKTHADCNSINICCLDECVNPENDEDNCGACGTRCNVGQYCIDSRCVTNIEEVDGDNDSTEDDKNNCNIICIGRCDFYQDCYCDSCSDGERCEDNVCIPDLECFSDTDCPIESICNNGECQTGCNTDEQCAEYKICMHGQCNYGCRSDNDCIDELFWFGTYCIDYECSECKNDNDCEEFHICEENDCKYGCRSADECGQGGICHPTQGCVAYFDEQSELMWTLRVSDYKSGPSGPWSYCANLTTGGHDDWRMPNIDELRTLIRGCEATMPNGECTASRYCLDSDCRPTNCEGCERREGPGESGCYLPYTMSVLSWTCGFTWTDSTYCYEGSNCEDLYVDFKEASVRSMSYHFNEGVVRCVR